MTTPQDDLPVIEERRREFINGKWIASSKATGKHMLTLSRVGMLLGWPFDLGRGGPGGWWIIDAPQVLFYRNKMIPDLAGWRKERLPEVPDVSLIEVVPDWVCEVISPGSRKADRQVKPPIYWQSGVKFMWLIEPEAQRVEVFSAGERNWVLEGFFQAGDLAKMPPFEAVEVSLLDLWGQPPIMTQDPPDEL